jgi:hypothetical protein
MNRITHLSRHAMARLSQRSTLNFSEVARILDCFIFVDIGGEPGFNRQHRLFFSTKDDRFYVAIQDIHTGGVVTILPPEYHENISWKIKDKDYIEAKNLALSAPEFIEGYDEKPSSKPSLPSTFIITAIFSDINNDRKVKKVLKVPATQYGLDIKQLTCDKSLDKNINKSLNKNGIASELVWGISIRLGRKGEIVFFDWSKGALMSGLMA